MEAELPVLQTAKKNYAQVLDYRTYQRSDKSPKYDETVSKYMAKLVKKVKS